MVSLVWLLMAMLLVIQVGSENDTEDDTCYVCNTDLYWCVCVRTFIAHFHEL